MKYYSTRDKNKSVSAAEAIARGLSEDGGLFLPREIPKLSKNELNGLLKLSYRERAVDIMGRYLDGFTEDELKSSVAKAYGGNFDDKSIAPLRFTDDNTAFLELWHGPTCAFKDMALQILPHLLIASLKKLGEKRKVCILVATSGDTGKAALEGFAGVEGTSIMVFYPRDGVSDVQKLQMVTQRGNNVTVSAVEGNFDDAQTGVKLIFGDRSFGEKLDGMGCFLSSANSINWGRLLPQIVYYFSAYCDYVNSGKITMGDEIDFCVPTGNFGDILAGWYAKNMGLPVRRLICASNSNNVLTDFINTGVYDRNRPFHTTISPSMDILVSSNLERLLFMCSDDVKVKTWMEQLTTEGKYTIDDHVREKIAEDFDGGCCTDGEAETEIKAMFSEKKYLMDPHTADAYAVLKKRRAGERPFPTVVVSTASPFKFCDSVLDALGQGTDAPGTELLEKLSAVTGAPVPKPLAELKGLTTRFDGCASKEKMPDAVLDFVSSQAK